MTETYSGNTREQLIAELRRLRRRVEQLESLNEETKARFEAFMANSPAVAFIKDEDGRLLYINKTMVETFDFHNVDWYGKTDAELWPPETASAFRANDVEILKGGEPVQIEETIARPDGLYYWLSFKFPFRDRFGKYYLGGTAVEITELKNLQEKLRESHARLTAHMTFTPMLAVTWDEQLRCIEWNPTAHRTLNVTRDQALGMPLHELLTDDDDVSAIRAPYEQFLSGSDVHITATHEVAVARSQSSNESASKPAVRRTIEWYHTKLTDHDGALLGVASLGRDITERLAQQAELRAAKEQAESMTQAKSRFLANMSHEIRTPMHGILGTADLLNTMDLPGEAGQYARLIHHSTKVLLGIVDDVLSLSRIEGGVVEVRSLPFDMQQLVRHIQLLFHTEATRRGLSIDVDLGGLRHTRFLGDELLIRQILSNLVGNALKFTPAGYIRVRASSRPIADTPDDSAVVIAVEDTGVGITEERRNAIFERFTQADESPTRTFGGTGLGLTISRQLALLMGGDIECLSEVGVGSSFTLQIRLRHHDGDFTVEDKERALRNYQKRVLVVEDNRINQLIARKMLESMGLDIDMANNGHEAVTKVQECAYDLVLMDLHMPVMGGIEATRHLRRLPDGRGLPIIAMTADVMERARDACTEVGMNGYLNKPISHDGLIQELDRWFGC